MRYTDTNVYFASTMTEIDAMNAIISHLTSLDSCIVCMDTTAEQYADSSNTATFRFNMDNKYIFRITRTYVNSATCRTFIFENIVNGQSTGSRSLRLWRYETYPTGVIGQPAILNVKSSIGSNAMLIWMYAEYGTESFNTALVNNTSNSESYCGYSTNDTLYGASFFRCSDSSSGYSMPKIINFAAPAGHIAYSPISPITLNGTYVTSIDEVYSCSTVTRGSTIALPNGENYRAIETNSMIKIVN